MSVTDAIEHHESDVIDGLRLHAAESGAGPPLVLLHGFTGSAETWTPFRSTFDAAHRVIAFDLPGHGRSTSPADPQRYRLDRFVGDFAHMLDSMSVDRVALLGYSMGGRAALRFALSHGDRVAALILESTSPEIIDPDARAKRRASDAALADDIERDGIEAFVDRWESLPIWASQHNLPAETRALLREQRMRNDARGLANSLRGAGAGEDSDVLEALYSIKTPVLLIAGALDSKYVELSRSLGGLLPDCGIDVVPGAGHAVHLEQPEAFAASTMAFLSRIPRSSNRWT